MSDSATGLLQAVDKEENVILPGFAPRDRMVPKYDLELTPATSAMAIL